MKTVYNDETTNPNFEKVFGLQNQVMSNQSFFNYKNLNRTSSKDSKAIRPMSQAFKKIKINSKKKALKNKSKVDKIKKTSKNKTPQINQDVPIKQKSNL